MPKHLQVSWGFVDSHILSGLSKTPLASPVSTSEYILERGQNQPSLIRGRRRSPGEIFGEPENEIVVNRDHLSLSKWSPPVARTTSIRQISPLSRFLFTQFNPAEVA